MEIKELIKIVDTYYPAGLLLNDPEFKNKTELFNAYKKINKGSWNKLLASIRDNFNIEITEFSLEEELDPSFKAVLITEQYERPKPEGYQPCQLIFKISVIAPVYSIYFDNLDSDSDKRIIRANPVTQVEKSVFDMLGKDIVNLYSDYSFLDISVAYHSLQHLGNISASNKRKPYLDECLYGIYLSIHPYNYDEDKFQS